MLERIASALQIDTPQLFALEQFQKNWESLILAEVEKLIASKIDELNNSKQDCV
jgi:hypothetical protein